MKKKNSLKAFLIKIYISKRFRWRCRSAKCLSLSTFFSSCTKERKKIVCVCERPLKHKVPFAIRTSEPFLTFLFENEMKAQKCLIENEQNKTRTSCAMRRMRMNGLWCWRRSSERQKSVWKFHPALEDFCFCFFLVHRGMKYFSEDVLLRDEN